MGTNLDSMTTRRNTPPAPAHDTSVQTAAASTADLRHLPDFALIDVKAVAALHCCSECQIWRNTKAGRIPQPLRLSPRVTRWRLGDIRKHLEELSPT